MPDTAEVAVLPAHGGWVSACTIHGVLCLYSAHPYAAWDALGHAAAHHPLVVSRG